LRWLVVVIAVGVAVLLVGVFGVSRMVGDPGWGYRVRGTPRKSSIWTDDEVSNDPFGVTTRLRVYLFAGGINVDWEIINRKNVPLEFAGVAAIVLDAKGKVLPNAIPPAAWCGMSVVANPEPLQADSCKGSVLVDVQPLVRRWLWVRPNADLDVITLVVEGVRRNGAPLPLRFELVAHE
jgi:hypothetical protein